MEQLIGLSIEQKVGSETYITLLPKELRALLYKYLFLKSDFDIKVTLNNEIDPFIRMYQQEAQLHFESDQATLTYSFDIKFMKDAGAHISHFINSVTTTEPYDNLLMINDYTEFDIYMYESKLRIYVIAPKPRRGHFTHNMPLKIISVTTINLTGDILEALKKIADSENLN